MRLTLKKSLLWKFPLCLWICLAVPSALAQDQEPAQEEETDESAPDEALPTSGSLTEWLVERSWREMYFESVYSRFEELNLIGDLWVKQGIRLLTVGDSYLDAYVKLRLLGDRNADFWNNRSETALGVRYRPSNKLGLFLFAEAIHGRYYGREGKDRNPYPQNYRDFQAGYTFWQWWGKEAWQIEGFKTYWPFTGWREVYADGIHFLHQDSNFIATFDYKEGLMLANIGGFKFDSYITFEGAMDTNQDFWNNFWKIGPGIRVTPFENLDLKISLEYFRGGFYRGRALGSSSRGGSGPDEEDFTDFLVSIAFWHGW